MIDTTFTSQSDYSAALAEHTAAGGTVDAFEAINGTHYAAEKPLAPTKDQQETGQGGLSPAEWAAEKASFLAQGGSLETWNQIIGQDAATAEINGSLDDNVADTIAALMAAGKSEEEINTIFAEHGIELTGQVQDDRTDTERLHDAHHPDVKPSDYVVGPIAPAEGVDLNAHHAAMGELRTMLADVQLDADVGGALIGEMIETGRTLAGQSAPAQELWVREQAALLDRVSNGQGEAWRADADQLLAHANASVVEAFRRSGVLNSASFVASLHHHAERLRARGEP